jgi:hypothetical protein
MESKKEEVKQHAQEPVKIARWERWSMKLSIVTFVMAVLNYTGLGAWMLGLFG